MTMILSTKSKSVMLTQILTIMLFVFLVAMLFFIPSVGKWYSSVAHATAIRPTDNKEAAIALSAVLYAAEIPALPAVISVWKLLSNITDERIFVQNNVKLLRILSYCCFAVTVIFIFFGIYTFVSLAIALAAAFMGLILRVLKNVFSKAVELREENDLTV